MPGWIIQGVRGEGKSLAAVGKAKQYLLAGRPVATNLDLYLENFLPAGNRTLAYRLPDHPRLEDFQMLPPAYDPKYKAEDKNGLLILDELGTWLNARSWNQKDRLSMLNWLFLSRKDHWDIILLAQDHEMIDAQVRTTLCDYLVQASRMDRQKIPYLGNILKLLGLNAFFPRIHKYHVFYGLSTSQPVTETWTFTGRDFYSGYDTNQKFKDGMEALNGTLVDMRATYSYLPAAYLTKQVFIDRLQDQIDSLKKLASKKTEVDTLAAKSKMGENPYIKIGLLSLGLVVLLGYKFLSGGLDPSKVAQSSPVAPVVSSPSVVPAPAAPALNPVESNTVKAEFVAVETDDVISQLLKQYRPRLSVTAYSPEIGYVGTVDFYDKYELVETYTIKELHALGVALVRKPYGADFVYKGKTFLVSAWRLPSSETVQDVAPVAFADPSVSSPADKAESSSESLVSSILH